MKACFYRPAAVTQFIVKWLEKLLRHTSRPASQTPWTLTSLHTGQTDQQMMSSPCPPQHLAPSGKSHSYARLLFIAHSFAFSTIPPNRLFHKITNLGLIQSMCSWMLDQQCWLMSHWLMVKLHLDLPRRFISLKEGGPDVAMRLNLVKIRHIFWCLRWWWAVNLPSHLLSSRLTLKRLNAVQV